MLRQNRKPRWKFVQWRGALLFLESQDTVQVCPWSSGVFSRDDTTPVLTNIKVAVFWTLKINANIFPPKMKQKSYEILKTNTVKVMCA